MSVTGFNRRRRIAMADARVDKSGPYPVLVPLDDPKPSTMRPDQKSGNVLQQLENIQSPEEQRLRDDDTGDVVQSHNFPPRGLEPLPSTVSEHEGPDRFDKVRRSLEEAHDARLAKAGTAIDAERERVKAYHGMADENAGVDEMNKDNWDWTQPDNGDQQSINEPAVRVMENPPEHSLNHENPNAAILKAGADERNVGFVDPLDDPLPEEKDATYYQKMADGEAVSDDDSNSKTRAYDAGVNPRRVEMEGEGGEGDESGEKRRDQKATKPRSQRGKRSSKK